MMLSSSTKFRSTSLFRLQSRLVADTLETADAKIKKMAGKDLFFSVSLSIYLSLSYLTSFVFI